MSNPSGQNSPQKELLSLEPGLSQQKHREYRQRLDTLILRASRREKIMRLATIIITGIALTNFGAILLLTLFMPVDAIFYKFVDLLDPPHRLASPLYDFAVIAILSVSAASILFSVPLIAL